MTDLFENTQHLFPQFGPWLANVEIEKTIPKIILNVLELSDSDLYSHVLQYCEDNNIDFEYNAAVSTRILNSCMSPLANVKIENLSDFDNTFLLDPYNPRISTASFDPLNEVKIQDFIDDQEACRKKLDDESQEICTSIQTAGYQRGNSIKVVSLTGKENSPYVVLEGNTRMAAIRKLIKSGDKSLLFDFSDVDICEMNGFSYRTFFPLKLEMLKTIHLGGVKQWSAYKQARALQISRDQILKDQPELADPKKENKLVNLIRNGSRLKTTEVKHQLDTIDLMDRSVKLVNSDFNMDGYVLVDSKEFEDMYSYFYTGVTKSNVNDLILQKDETLWGFLIQCGIIYLPNASKTLNKTI